MTPDGMPPLSSSGLGLSRPGEPVPAHDATQQRTYWGIADIEHQCRISRSTAWRLVRREGFPAPVVLTRRCLMWPRGEVIDFIERHRDPMHYVATAAGKPVSGPTRVFSSRPIGRSG